MLLVHWSKLIPLSILETTVNRNFGKGSKTPIHTSFASPNKVMSVSTNHSLSCWIVVTLSS